MHLNLIADEIEMMLSASNFLRMVKDVRKRKTIIKSTYVPPVLGSNSLGTFKVTLKHESRKKATELSPTA
jgi:hypothetical protein